MTVIAVDFDGTIADIRGIQYPDVGDPLPGAVEYLNKLNDLGYCLIIWTCRDSIEIDNVKEYLKKHGIPYHHINENCKERMAFYGNDTRKIGAACYIDDRSIHTMMNGGINWKQIYEYIIQNIPLEHPTYKKCKESI